MCLLAHTGGLSQESLPQIKVLRSVFNYGQRTKSGYLGGATFRWQTYWLESNCRHTCNARRTYTESQLLYAYEDLIVKNTYVYDNS